MENETKECLEVTRDTARKVDDVIKAYREKDRQCDILSNAVRWLSLTLMTLIIVAGMVCGMFVYGYLYSPYMYGTVVQTATQFTDGNIAQIIK